MRGGGLMGLDRMTAIEAKLDAVINKLGSNEKRMHTAYEVGAVRAAAAATTEGQQRRLSRKDEPKLDITTKHSASKGLM